MSQNIENIKIEDLVLWTENPRDPIDSNAKDQDVVDNALNDKQSKWTLAKLAKEMKGYYDLSELPTVVYHGKKPVVYDGNRRMILAKIKYDCVSIDDSDKIDIPDFPETIPCNVCSKDIAIKNVFRKHGDSGTWSPLDRDIFLNKFLKQPKSLFLKIEESTNALSSYPKLNQGFVKKEIFTEEKLKELGYEFDDNKLLSKHTKQESKKILQNIAAQITSKNLSTRKNRGDVISSLDKDIRKIVERNKNNVAKEQSLHITPKKEEKKKRQTKISKYKPIFFGEILYLKHGAINDIHRDLIELEKFYQANKDYLSSYFPSLIRMSLRLLCEAAAKEQSESLQTYLNKHFAAAKKSLDQDAKTTLSSQNVKDNTIVQLLQAGAHAYEAGQNYEQARAISIIIGQILKITYGK
ncbi:hypothetical protein ACH3PA_07235 [Leeuwenhoekiella sp. A2]|uniref:hypothetical protein n=1 Tax=Leeuwenhoekiella sp. A2 TaxID=3141460 RepID=UPI003A7FFE96